MRHSNNNWRMDERPLDNPRWEKYCLERAAGKSQRQAMLAAYPQRVRWKPETLDSKACTLERDGRVKARLEILKRHAAQSALLSRSEVLSGMSETLRKAIEANRNGISQVGIHAVSSIGKTLLDALPADEERAPEARIWDFGLILAPPHLIVHREVARDNGGDWWMYGGRQSAKSSAVSLEIAAGVTKHSDRSAIVFLKVGRYIREGVYEQMLWALEELGIAEEWECTVQPMQMLRRSTGQVIRFRGCDKADKSKTVKAPAGTYYAYQWYEEADQFSGMAEIRKLQQSYTRGPEGSPFFRFYTFNPPRTASSWSNRIIAERESKGLPVYRSNYLEVPSEWVSEQIRQDALQLKLEDELAYRHEYLGEPVGNGTQVFDRAEFREISNEEIATFDNHKAGQDFGWYPDPWAMTLSEWNPATRTLITYAEDGANKLTPPEQADRIKVLLTWKDDGNNEHSYHYLPVLSDDADPQAIASQRDSGINARAAGKGGMRDASYRWLASIHWVIDPVRCPRLAAEVRELSYAVSRDGEVLNEIPDGNDHFIDATRYAVMQIVHKARSAYRGATFTSE